MSEPLKIPELCLVVLVGASGSGKSTFARLHFRPTEVLSSDFCRGLIADDENDQAATRDAFEVLHFVAGKRLRAGRLTVIDATNVQPEARAPLVHLAREHDVLPVAIVLDLPEDECHARNQSRPDRNFGRHVTLQHVRQLRRSLRHLGHEGFRRVHVLSGAAEIDAAAIVREPLWTDRRSDHGPFDIIGDVHGCCDELEQLLELLGYAKEPAASAAERADALYRHPAGRRVVFLGDLVDRGPRVVDTLRLVQNMVAAGTALCVPGNHDAKLLRKLQGRDVKIAHGLAQTLAEIDALPEAERVAFSQQTAAFLDDLVSHYVLDDGKLVVAHAGMKEAYQGRASTRVRNFALFGETTGETDEFGLPVRCNWAAEYRGQSAVVYGHTPVPQSTWLNNTINIDTGCVFGGRLTALRYPERELLSVPAARMYCEPARPLVPVQPAGSELSSQHQADDLLDLADVTGKRIISTRLVSTVTIREEHSTAALEVMSRFAANPKWLIYLPPTMSPSETSRREGLLEHPAEAFAYFRSQEVPNVICQRKHMGSRAVVVVCRDEEVARSRFGIVGDGSGICFTRTGRRFFDDPATERFVIDTVRAAAEDAGMWDEFATGWLCLDCELLPWSAKAQELLTRQYAPVGAAAAGSLTAAIDALRQACSRVDLQEPAVIEALLSGHESRLDAVRRYVAAYRGYCWPVASPADLRLAPFHLLATEGAVHTDKNQAWHMQTLARLCAADRSSGPLLLPTEHCVVDLADPASESAAIEWWEKLTGAGGEGMVVKPLDWIVRGPKGLVQPAVKCRGPEYLRIIYGPEYTRPENLERLRSRGLGAKRSLAVREFALGLEALERFVAREPLRRVHECVFGVLALESEPVDPRL